MPRQDFPSNSQIEAVIQAATSGVTITGQPLKDTRTQLFVGNLPYRVRWQDLKDLFRSHLPSPQPTSPNPPSLSPLPQQPTTTTNPILRADVSLGPDNRSRGFGTVLMSNKEDAYRAVEQLNGYCWQGRVLEVRIDRVLGTGGDSPAPSSSANSFSVGPSAGYGPGGQQEFFGTPGSHGGGNNTGYVPPDNIRNLGKSLIVGNLPPSIQWQELKDLFRSAGTIVRADIAPAPQLPVLTGSFSPFTPQDVNPPPLRGSATYWGTVTYASTLDRERAISVFDGWEWRGHKLIIRPLESVMNDSRVASVLLASASPPPTASSRPSTGLGSEHSASGSTTSGLGALSHLDPNITNPNGIANADVLLSVLRANASAPASGYSSVRSQSPRRPPGSYPSSQSLHAQSQPRPIPSSFGSDPLATSPRTGSFFSGRSSSPLSSSSLGKSIAKSQLEKSAAERFSSPLTSKPSSHSGSMAGSPFSTAAGVPSLLRPEARSPRSSHFGFESGSSSTSTLRRGSTPGAPSDVPFGSKGKERQPIPDFEPPVRDERPRSRSRGRGTQAIDLTEPQPRPRPTLRSPLPPPQQQRQHSPSSQIHPSHHPGPITLPSTPVTLHQMGQMMPLATPPLPSPYGYPQTPPLYSPHHPVGMGSPMHPHNPIGLGLPPLTPSMPSFSFMPPATHTPTYHPQYLSPGLMGTPGAAGMMAVMNMSGAFTNIAEHPGTLGGITPLASSAIPEEGYFQLPTEYFPPMPLSSQEQRLGPEQGQAGLTQDDSPLGTDQGSHDNSRRASTSGLSTAESELDLHNFRTGSSVATTVEEDTTDGEGKSPAEAAVVTGKMERMSLEHSSSDKVIKSEDMHTESLHRSKSIDANMLQLGESDSSTSASTASPERASATATAQSSQTETGIPTSSPEPAKPKARMRPHPTFQASEFASIVSGFPGIVPPHMQGDDDGDTEAATGLTPGHGRRASWTPGTEYSSYM